MERNRRPESEVGFSRGEEQLRNWGLGLGFKDNFGQNIKVWGRCKIISYAIFLRISDSYAGFKLTYLVTSSLICAN